MYFRTWTLLQTHLREAHPPTCPYPECAGKTFSKPHLLKNHLRKHGGWPDLSDGDEDGDGDDMDVDGVGSDWDVGENAGARTQTRRALKRRRLEDRGESFFPCTEPNCPKVFKTVSTSAYSAPVPVEHT